MATNLKSFLRAKLPRPVWVQAAHIKNSVLDLVTQLSGRADPLMPPRAMIFTGSGDFREIGEHYLVRFIDAGLKPDHHVLEIGSGIGRMAIPLTRYLQSDGRFDGLEIVPQGVEWCRNSITSRHPNFQFHRADVHNTEYNAHGAMAAASYVFPFDDATFDFVFLTSVFTHMLPADVDNYLGQIARVLRPGGSCLITWYVVNGASPPPASPDLPLKFVHPVAGHTGCLTTNPAVPEEAIAYQETWVRQAYASHDLSISKFDYGGLKQQDICVAHKSW